MVLQEVTRTGAVEAVAALARAVGLGWLGIVTGAMGDSGHASGECYALLYNTARVTEALGGVCQGAARGVGEGVGDRALQVEAFMYDREHTGSAAFRQDAMWDKETIRRADFGFQGAGGARRPGYFRLHHSGSGRSLILATMHGVYDNKELRVLQFRALCSLLPARPVESSRVVFALLGDFNSDAINTVGLGTVSFAQTAEGKKMARAMKKRCDFINVSPSDKKTSIAGYHYDEIFVADAARGKKKREATVFPEYERFHSMRGARAISVFTPEKLRPTAADDTEKKRLGQFKSKVYTDHFLVCVDVEFTCPLPPPPPPVAAAAAAAAAVAVVAAPPPPADDLKSHTVIELKTLLRARGLTVSGNRQALIDRLRG